MTKVLLLVKSTIILLLVMLTFYNCHKSPCTSTYTMYLPVYKTLNEVSADIKSNPATPLKTPGKMFVSGSYIFLNETEKGIHIIDNADPASPVNKYFINIPGNIDIAVSGKALYADMYQHMVTIDITDPANVQVKNVAKNVFPRIYSGLNS